jgi:hypothetical protein
MVDQNLRRRGLIGSCGPHQCRLLGGFVARVYGGVVAEKQRDRVGVARARGGHQRGVSILIGGVGIRAALEQFADNRGVTVHRCVVERGDAVAIGGVGVSSGVEQQVHCVGIVVLDRPVEGCRAIREGCVNVGFLLEQVAEGGLVLLSDGFGNAGSGLGEASRSKQHDERGHSNRHNRASLIK